LFIKNRQLTLVKLKLSRYTYKF